ncbi:DUF6889 family protein [Silvimonas soli]|nr:hypothetical protein [Silvimonas soli]
MPVLKGWVKYESLKDGSIDLADLALLHDMARVQADNETIAYDMRKQNNG